MIFYYAAGGGLGHLTRARAVLHTLNYQAPVTILTASTFADDRRVTGDLQVIKIPPSLETNLREYRDWLHRLFVEQQPEEVIVDAFPAGLLGEFCDFAFPAPTKLLHIARLLRWQEYGKQLTGMAPRFDVTYRLEPLASQHEDFLRRQSAEICPLRLEDPPHELTDEVKELAVHIMRPSVEEYTLVNRRQATHRPVWLIVHAGPGAEIAQLLAYTEEMRRIEQASPRLILLAPTGPGIDEAVRAVPLQLPFEHYDFYPATAFFRFAERIITACGFNAMRQTEPYHDKHRFLPFERRFDDQFQRAAWRRRREDNCPVL